MTDWLTSLAMAPVLRGLAALLNSNFITALLGSLAGALGGAWAAQRIAEKGKAREFLLRDIRQLNAASIILNGIANTHIGLKKQHIKRLKEDFEEQRNNLLLFLEARKAGTVPPQQTFEFRADMETLNPPYLPLDQLRRLMFDELSLQGGELFVLQLLLGSVRSVRESLELRNDLIREWKQAQLSQDAFVPIYFGIAQGRIVDQRYSSTIDAIYTMNDNVIAFSMMLADTLTMQAKRKRDLYLKRFRGEPPKVTIFDFTQAAPFLPEWDDDLKKFAKMLETAPAGERSVRFYRRLWHRIRHRNLNSQQPSSNG